MLKVKNARRHAPGITVIHLLSKSMILYWISGMICDGSESLETLKSMTKTKWRSIGLIGFHGSIEITDLYIMEKSQMLCHPIDHLIMPLTSKQGRSPSGDISTHSQKKSCKYSRNTLRKCSTRVKSAQASRQQERLFSFFQSHMAEAYDCVWTIEDSIESLS